MEIAFTGIAPHPPLLIPEVGGKELKKVAVTANALRELGYRVLQSGAELLIVISPHGQAYRDSVAVTEKGSLKGDFSAFNAGDVKMSFDVDEELAALLKEELQQTDIPASFLSCDGSAGVRLDHGAGVPLYYLQKQGVELPGLHITPGFLSYDELFTFGRALRRAVMSRGKKVALIASGDLSHRLIPGAPAGYDPRGKEFDDMLVELLSQYQVPHILNIDPDLVEAAGECGLGSFTIMLGYLHGLKVTPEIMSYEAPFGVGYLVASFKAETGLEGLREIIPSIARNSIVNRLEKRKEILPVEEITPELEELKGGAFVTLKKNGQLRGCIGTIEGVHENLAQEITANAINAAFDDPRFPPLQKKELVEVEISVDILSPLEPVKSLEELDPKKYGIFISNKKRSGLLLPNLEGVNSVEEQLAITLEKAGIRPREKYDIYRFTVTRFGEK